MMFAARKLRGIGLIVLLTVLALLVYSVNLQVSTTRTALRDVQQRIASLQAANRLIEGDIAVLANARQLDQWNRDYFGLQAANATQYLQGERALASLDSLRPLRGVPREPVQTAMADTRAVTNTAATTLVHGNNSITQAVANDALVTNRRNRLRDLAMRDIAAPSSALRQLGTSQ